MSKKRTETKKRISIKHSQNISFIIAKTICHHQKIFWISLPLFAWKQDYLPHSDKIYEPLSCDPAAAMKNRIIIKRLSHTCRINTGVFSGCPYYIPLPYQAHGSI